MSWYRVPLNAFIILFLLIAGAASTSTMIMLCSVTCTVALAAHLNLTRLVAQREYEKQASSGV